MAPDQCGPQEGPHWAGLVRRTSASHRHWAPTLQTTHAEELLHSSELFILHDVSANDNLILKTTPSPYLMCEINILLLCYCWY